MEHKHNGTLTVASYNVRAGLGSDLRRDARRVLHTIAGLGADIVALQEADFRMGPRPTALPFDMVRAETGLEPVAVESEVSIGWHGNAILARPGLPVEEIRRLDLPGLEPRGALAVDFGGALPLRVVGVHLGLLRRSRRQQLDALRDTLSDWPALPTAILGDFNEWSGRRGLGRIARDYRILTPGRTFPSTLPIGSLDRVVHSPDLDVSVLHLPRRRGPHASDHLPVAVRIARAG
ncbi:endonuclease/exonuclease/phosphatase family protein [Wenxinia saemankumensis]|uniref:Metal-dependent hydrolase, endonuclease/exonuclease/phosphatase family n=1 Tax=Wenxinia saemankumensis TaxID=1447782 RepID=A0A1M6EGK3_9RHOB|nr:endonuclease/exonuclease/phosphatase family protein [Wenxinia saemankumensis]SHI84647.1 Metal-dependent hydrolase, endonuclease/exonuclease/phosphatase family [Wenxinia saemankumensis]